MDSDQKMIRCSANLNNGKRCGWFAFDQVTLFAEDRSNSYTPVTAYSCRNCGNLDRRLVSGGVCSELYPENHDTASSASIWDVKIGLPNVDAILAAIKNGGDTNETSENDYTLLMCAAQNGAIENVLCLLINDADPTAVSLGKTAAELAREENEDEIADIIEAFAQKQSNRKSSR